MTLDSRTRDFYDFPGTPAWIESQKFFTIVLGLASKSRLLTLWLVTFQAFSRTLAWIESQKTDSMAALHCGMVSCLSEMQQNRKWCSPNLSVQPSSCEQNSSFLYAFCRHQVFVVDLARHGRPHRLPDPRGAHRQHRLGYHFHRW